MSLEQTVNKVVTGLEFMVELGRCSDPQGPWDVPGEGASGGVCVLTLADFMPAAPPELIYGR